MARGGARAGAGRPKGAPNKATRPIREAARDYSEQALLTLAEVMNDKTQAGPARVAAANALLDRGFGKPTQVVAGDDEGSPVKLVTEIVMRGVRAEHRE